jgi:hypothetical protein
LSRLTGQPCEPFQFQRSPRAIFSAVPLRNDSRDHCKHLQRFSTVRACMVTTVTCRHAPGPQQRVRCDAWRLLKLTTRSKRCTNRPDNGK